MLRPVGGQLFWQQNFEVKDNLPSASLECETNATTVNGLLLFRLLEERLGFGKLFQNRVFRLSLWPAALFCARRCRRSGGPDLEKSSTYISQYGGNLGKQTGTQCHCHNHAAVLLTLASPSPTVYDTMLLERSAQLHRKMPSGNCNWAFQNTLVPHYVMNLRSESSQKWVLVSKIVYVLPRDFEKMFTHFNRHVSSCLFFPVLLCFLVPTSTPWCLWGVVSPRWLLLEQAGMGSVRSNANKAPWKNGCWKTEILAFLGFWPIFNGFHLLFVFTEVLRGLDLPCCFYVQGFSL